MSSFLTAFSSLASQYGEAKDLARKEEEARKERLQEFGLRERQLGLEEQAGQRAQEAGQRAQQEFEFRKKQGRYIDFGLPMYSEGGKRYKQFWDTEAGKWSAVELPGSAGGDALSILKRRVASLPKEQQSGPVDEFESEFEATGDQQKGLEKANALVDRLIEENTRQKALDARAEKSRQAAAERQRAGFKEREKLSAPVTKAQTDAIDADSRVQRMIDDIQSASNAELNPAKFPDGAGAFDMDLLSQHIALTFGAIKGGVRSKAMIDEHRDAVSLLERVKRAYQGGAHGSQLTPGQRANFLKLGQIAQKAAWDKYDDLRKTIQGYQPLEQQQFDLQPEQ